MTFVKVCGLKNEADIDEAVRLGYDAIGIVTASFSKRYIEPVRAAELAEYAKGKIKSFAVGVSYDQVAGLEKVFDHIQISEDKDIENLVLSVEEEPDGAKEIYIYDASMGQGKFTGVPEWHKKHKVILAGGLNPDNVGGIVAEFEPFGVDVSSGVEENGVKSYEKMKKFIDAVRKAEK